MQDYQEYRRRERRLHWCIAFCAAPVLFLITWGLLTLGGSAAHATSTLAQAATPALFCLAAMCMFNTIEALIPSLIVMALICLAVPTYRSVKEKREKTLEKQAARFPQSQQATKVD